MAGAHFVPNSNLEQNLQRVFDQQLRPAAEEQASEEATSIAQDVADDMAGRPAAQIHAELVGRLQEHFGPRWEPGEDLHKVAADIEAGTFNG